jgi:hypothetical protein
MEIEVRRNLGSLPALLLLAAVGCADSTLFGQGEPCFFAFEEDGMNRPAFCALNMTARDPCFEIADCLCQAWLPEASDEELDACVADELSQETDVFRMSLLCGTPENLSVEDVVRSYAVVREARLSIAGPCAAMPTYRPEITLGE